MLAIQQQLLTALRKFGAEPMNVSNTKFDPNYHEAVAVKEEPGYSEGDIVSVMQTGYTMNNGSLLRAAKVIVASNQTTDNTE